MGQGYSLTTLSAGSAGIDVPELSDLAHERSLGDARFIKAVRARNRQGLVVAKVVMKPFARERKLLADIPNTLAYHRAFETSANGYLIRQYVYNSIYDRMSTRPFLEDVEKRWIAFQLLNAVKECHSSNVYHGDIKSENALVTSWNWLFLADFSASFKPTYLPEDNPADFSFFFDISGRRTCYLAPERFLSPGERADGRGGVTWAMDIFSVGCVIAELFLETPIFNLSQLFNYRKGEYDPFKAYLTRIGDSDLQELIMHMIQLEPEARYSADEYLNFWRQKTFPEYFYSFLHQYMYLITDPSSGRAAVTAEEVNFGESDDRISRVYNDFDKISYFLDYNNRTGVDGAVDNHMKSPSIFPLHLDIPYQRPIVSRRKLSPLDDGTFLFLNIVTSSLRSTARAKARLEACELLLAFAEHISDEAKLDRILPFVMSLIDDRSEVVKVTALRTLAQLVALIGKTSPVNAYIFPEYIMPKLVDVFQPRRGSRPPPGMRIAYAQCLAPLAETGARFLDSIQALKAEGSLPRSDPSVDGALIQSYQNVYDIARADLLKFFESQTKTLLTDQDPSVRRTFLGSVASLCVFFGSARASDVILSHLNTYLNDKDWKLKCAFFDSVVGIAIYVGSSNVEEFILPLMIPALTDQEEFVIERVIRSFSAMAQLGLFQRSTTWDLVELIARFTMHPNTWIREVSASFLSSSTSFLSTADCQCIVRPRLDPYLRFVPMNYSEMTLLDALKKPLTRSIFDQILLWASKTERGLFWKQVEKRRSSNKADDRLAALPSRDLSSNAFAKTQKNDEDQRWITRLKDAGMSQEDEIKLLALSDYIWRIAKQHTTMEYDAQVQNLNQLVKLSELRVPINNVTFENQRQVVCDDPKPSRVPFKSSQQRSQTIADALLDASTTIGEPGSLQNSSNGTNTPTSVPRRMKSNAGDTASPRVSSPLRSGGDEQAPEAVHSSGGKHSGGQNETGRLRDDAQYRGSAIDLMPGRGLSGKATAETSTSPASVQGKVGGMQNGDVDSETALEFAQQNKQAHPTEIHYRGEGGYNYGGRDPNVLRLLDTLYLDNYPLDNIEFGPLVVPFEQRPDLRKGSERMDKNGRPDGTMVAMFGEHSGPVTRVVVSPDHLFFITGSDDGTVKVWDTGRLERNLAHRSRQTYKHGSGARVTSLCFIENTHCFVSTASDGSLSVVKVDCSETSQATTKYGKLRVLRQWQLPLATSKEVSTVQTAHTHPHQQHQPVAVWTSHQRSDPHSLLHIATSASQIHALDLRTMQLLYTLHSPLHHGIPTTFCVGHDKFGAQHWLLLGTSNGVCDLWDLRFRLRLKSFAFPGCCPIDRIVLHPNRESRKVRVLIAGGTGGGDVMVWDLERWDVREVFRTDDAGSHGAEHSSTKADAKKQHASNTAANPSLKPYTPWFPDTTPRSTLLSRLSESDSSAAGSELSTFTAPPPSVRQVHALATGSRPTENSMSQLEEKQYYFVTAGGGRKHDLRVRYWDMQRIENSCVISGLDAASPPQRQISDKSSQGRAPPQPVYTTAGRAADCVVYEERDQAPSEGNKEGESEARKAKSTRSGSLVGERQQRLLRSHLDVVLDVAVLERPCWMVVSVDRSGIVFVFT